MDIDILTDLRAILQKYISDSTTIPCDVKIYSTDQIATNTVIIQEATNVEYDSTTNKEETISNLVYQIDIYSPLDFYTTTINNEEQVITLSKVEQARNISKLINDVMQKKMKFRRYYCRPTPNIDNNVYRITMQYTIKYHDNTKMFLR